MKQRTASARALAALLAASEANAGDGLGRLFTTEAERAALEAAREAPTPSSPSTGAAATLPVVTFDGLILRQGAPLVAWVNGRAAPPAQWRERSGFAASVQSEGLWLRHSRKHLKAGQTGFSHGD